MSWRERGACAGVNPALFFPDVGEAAHRAKAVCAGCPVREECLQYALEHREDEGVWGGLTRLERRALPRPRKRSQVDCGTEGGYRTHRRRGEDACDRCLAANAVAKAVRKSRKREETAA